jgi:threonylcarbamoyladenosine tRNA methylthiotransferase MtaB
LTRVALETLGCKLNQAESELLARQFTGAGYSLVSPQDTADIYILNTCTVTHIADSKSRHLLRMAHRRNPGALIVAIGCYPQRASDELANIEGVNLVIGNNEKLRLVELLQESGGSGSTFNTEEEAVDSSIFRTRSSIKVQDGCNKYCSYCIVPFVRGREKSLPPKQILNEIKKRVIQGYNEIVLTGTEIGSYYYTRSNLKGLLKKILNNTDISRIRLSSLQPQQISEELISLWKDRRLCPQFHLALQSGSDSVLKRMKRHYSTGDYFKAVSLIRNLLPDAAITTDIIVGFPGETDEEFMESYNFCRQIGFSRIHVFSYSQRSGTEAARFSNQLKAPVKKQRSQKMLVLAEESARNFSRQFFNKTMTVLWEQQSRGIWSGYTENYIKVYTKSNIDLTNKILPVKLVEIYKDGVWGEVEYIRLS